MSNRPELVETSTDPIKVERTGGVTWRVLAVVGVIAVVLGLALAKPWETGGGRAVAPPIAHTVPTPRPALTPVPTPLATSTPAPKPTLEPKIEAASGRMLCNAPQQWRLISFETDVFGPSRTMFGDDATLANGPTDPRILGPQLRATALNGIGVCRPNPGGQRVADLPFNAVTIWQVNGSGKANAVSSPRLLSDALYRLGEAYYGPPSTEPSWPTGRYVIQIDGAARNGQSLWIALNFVAV